MSQSQRVDRLEQASGVRDLPLLVVKTYDGGASYEGFEGQTFTPQQLDAARERHSVLVLEYVDDWRGAS